MTPEQAAERPPNSTEIVLGNGNDTLPDYELYTHRCAFLSAVRIQESVNSIVEGRRGACVHAC